LKGKDIDTQRLMIEQSIECSWAGIFEIKNNNNKNYSSGFADCI